MPKSGVAPLQRDTFGFTAAGGKLYAHGGEIGPSEYERSVCILHARIRQELDKQTARSGDIISSAGYYSANYSSTCSRWIFPLIP